MRLCDLKCKEVINEKDCKRLGCVYDIEFNCKSGCIEAFVVGSSSRFYSLFCKEVEYVIPFKCVRQIGDDIILVCVDEKCFIKTEESNDRSKDNFFGF